MTEQRPSLAEDDATEMTPYSKTDPAWRLENEVHFPQLRLGEDLFHYIARHIGQPKIPSLEFISQPEVINSQTMKDGRLQVVDVHGILDRGCYSKRINLATRNELIWGSYYLFEALAVLTRKIEAAKI